MPVSITYGRYLELTERNLFFKVISLSALLGSTSVKFHRASHSLSRSLLLSVFYVSQISIVYILACTRLSSSRIHLAKWLCYENCLAPRRQWQPTPVLLPEKSHGQRSLVGCSPRGRTESDTTDVI